MRTINNYYSKKMSKLSSLFVKEWINFKKYWVFSCLDRPIIASLGTMSNNNKKYTNYSACLKWDR